MKTTLTKISKAWLHNRGVKRLTALLYLQWGCRFEFTVEEGKID